eukprot:CAMPEP_0176445024 /NCGR_PEP_ID=MMETSP0127-20121128/23437_1 /TAXON_ID=938130 /ORGANISM="Platyophrya macrostoma, Strain WH" /LENGTH=32 /DNA_ID= /DNA_START= /DNA_END= /DNA_ORIENTATION=
MASSRSGSVGNDEVFLGFLDPACCFFSCCLPV